MIPLILLILNFTHPTFGRLTCTCQPDPTFGGIPVSPGHSTELVSQKSPNFFQWTPWSSNLQYLPGTGFRPVYHNLDSNVRTLVVIQSAIHRPRLREIRVSSEKTFRTLRPQGHLRCPPHQRWGLCDNPQRGASSILSKDGYQIRV